MRAIRQHRFGGPEVLVYEALPTPEPGPDAVLLEVHAACVNHYDILSRRGIKADLPLPRIVGIDVTGRVLAAPVHRPDLRPGTPVVVLGERLGNGGPGAYATHVCVHEEEVFPVPEGVDLVEVACLGISYLTAWYALHARSAGKPGDTLLIPGAGGGVAGAALQIAVSEGRRVIATTRGADKVAAALALGAERVIDYGVEDSVAAVLDHTGGRGVDEVLNAVGGATIAEGLRALRHGGRLLTIGTAYGRDFRFDGYEFLCRELELVGVNISFHSPEARHALLAEICEAIRAGRLRVHIDSRWPLSQAAAAHSRVEAHAHFGKVVLLPD